MKKHLFLYTILIVGAGFLGLFGGFLYTIHTNGLNLAKDAAAEIAQICADLYTDGASLPDFVQAGSDTRITVISADGRVLADSYFSEVESLENYLDRPEVLAADSGSPAAHIRRSETVGANSVYYAVKTDSGDDYVFIRVAVPVTEIDTYLFQSLPLLICLLLGVAAACLFVIRYVINRVSQPYEAVEQKLRLLSSGQYVPETTSGKYVGIDKPAREIDEIALVLQRSFTALQDEKTKAECILSNIGDGLFAVDEAKNIVLINPAAMGIFNVTPDIMGKNLNYLSYDKALIEAVDDCVRLAKNTLFDLILNGRTFFVAVKRLLGTNLTMVVLSDVTESRENAKQREEFFANASHELKTPLTAIKGFNELMSLNNKDENLRKYTEGISRETDRMLTLIGDMLRLSELENSEGSKAAPVSLAQIVSEVCETISTAASEKGITMEITGDAVVTAEPGHAYELVRNLVENAVRYNNPGGKVVIAIEHSQKIARLRVNDNGIGIPIADQARVFERFYRVEKSRSQRSGGTGLGLAIVKHICALYGWKLSLKSKLGVGTEVIVVFDT